MNAYVSEEDLKARVEDAIKHAADCVSTSELVIWFADQSCRGRYSVAWATFAPTLNVLTGSLLEGLVLSLYKPLEPEGKQSDGERVNLWKIINLAVRLKVIDAAVHDTLKEKLHSVAHIWSKVETLRHNLVAHGKAGLSVEDEMQRAGLISSEWKKLLSVYSEVLNALAEKIGIQGIDVEARREQFASNAERFFEVLNSRVES